MPAQPHDRLFKSLLRAFLPDLLCLVAPGVAAQLRLGRIAFLDKELLAEDSHKGRREADLEKSEPLVWALAAVMQPVAMSRAEHKLACLSRIASARLGEDREILLVNFVEEYLPLTLKEAEEYKILSARNLNREEKAMWMPWSERIKVEARKEGIQLGKQEGRELGLQKGLQKGRAQGEREGMRKLLLHLLTQRFGPLTEEVRAQIEAIDSTRRLTSLAGKVLKARSLGDLGFC